MDIGRTLYNDVFCKVWGNIKNPMGNKMIWSTNHLCIFVDTHLELPVYNSTMVSVYNPILINSIKRNLNILR